MCSTSSRPARVLDLVLLEQFVQASYLGFLRTALISQLSCRVLVVLQHDTHSIHDLRKVLFLLHLRRALKMTRHGFFLLSGVRKLIRLLLIEQHILSLGGVVVGFEFEDGIRFVHALPAVMLLLLC